MNRAHTSLLLVSVAALTIVLALVVSGEAIASGAMASETSPTVAAQGEVWQGSDDGDDDPQIGKLAFITIGAAAAAGLVCLAGYAVRRAVGYEPHRPGPEDESSHH